MYIQYAEANKLGLDFDRDRVDAIVTNRPNRLVSLVIAECLIWNVTHLKQLESDLVTLSL